MNAWENPHESINWNTKHNSQKCFYHFHFSNFVTFEVSDQLWSDVKWSRPGGDNGGIAEKCKSSVTSKTLLTVAWDTTPPTPIFLEENTVDVFSLDELVLSTDFKKLFIDEVVWAAFAITEIKTPDSLKLWIITCKDHHYFWKRELDNVPQWAYHGMDWKHIWYIQVKKQKTSFKKASLP